MAITYHPVQVTSQMKSNTSSQSQASSFKSNLRALKNMAIIMGLFVICWAPFLALSSVESTDPVYYRNQLTFQKFYSVALAMYWFNSVVNPVVYAVRFRNFNVAFRLMFGCVKDGERHAAMESVNSVWGMNSGTDWRQKFVEHKDLKLWRHFRCIMNQTSMKSWRPSFHWDSSRGLWQTSL